MREHDEQLRARLLYRVAHAYYEEDLTQAQIAARFGLSRIKVSRMLTRAREEGIVRISVAAPGSDHSELERELERAYSLDEAIVAEPRGSDYTDVLEAIGRAAADYLTRVLEDGSIVGLTWGNSILATVAWIEPTVKPQCRAVQLLGGLGDQESGIHGAELVRRVADRLGCRARNIHAPGIVSAQEVRDALVSDPQVAGTLELGRKSDVALVGVGALGPHSVLRNSESVLSEKDCRDLKRRGVVGDIGLRFFDEEGRPVATPYSDRIIGLDLDELRAIPRRVGIAGGEEKVKALRAALSAKYLNVLVTDPETAAKLIEKE